MLIARGVSRLSRLGVVKIWHAPGSEFVLLTHPWWKPQRGQSLSEYALLLAAGGALVATLWFTFPLTLTQVVRWSLDVLAPGSSFLVSGSF